MAYKNKFTSEIQNIISEDEWIIEEDNYDPRENLVYETLFGLASGYMGNRGSHEEGDVRRTLPANYIHGIFDRSEAFQRELCNTPDWNKLKMYYECEQIGIESGKDVKEYVRILDMKKGLVAKHYVSTAYDGRETRIEIIKFLSRKNPRCGAFKVFVTPLNYEGVIEFENIIDGTVTNFIDFPRFRVKHLSTEQVCEFSDFGCYLESNTRDDKTPIGTGTAVEIKDNDGNDRLKSRTFKKFGEIACEFLDADVKQGETIVIEKYANICTGRESDNVKDTVLNDLETFVKKGFDNELEDHIKEYYKLWDMADLQITGDEKMQKALRFNIFHVMSTPNPNDPSTNIGAKLIHGEEYGGHAFWDTELFILPFFNYVFPEVAHNLVEYRYRLLDKARENANKNGYEGAKYPWESADTGDEECPEWTIEPDGTCYRCYVADYEHHVTAAVAYGANRYYKFTKDKEFLDGMGLELIVETGRFWVSRLEYNEQEDRYEITKVTGPDEWHEPVDNNAYTNHLAKWNINQALKYLKYYKENDKVMYNNLLNKIKLDEDELIIWKDKVDKIYIKDKEGLIEQYDGYFNLVDAEIDEWDKNGMPILPKSLEAVKKEDRCILKQADVVMLMFLMEYDYDIDTQRTNFEYYEKRTLHRSSLSPSIHCLMGLRVGDYERAYEYLCRSAYVDMTNNQGNTREGIHAASAGGSWQCVTLGYCGMSVDNNGTLVFNPKLPDNWEKVSYSINWRGSILRILITQDDVIINSDNCNGSFKYIVDGEERIYGGA
ncbi:kojibiose phosphorylase [Vallitalea longa]|uniref:Kojibiose phosphorylase n=1 Tax=Vallitalea longa TaxID=2936439 RepID=A0A9W5YBF2_9FIRM|nr:glycosyl hydrolase family 65 protein [Vallitalea longa]GKX29288.1 kojibiose phosphorylase [Vallitalea longa]